MPEGDSLRRAEARLRPILDGQIVDTIWFKMLRGLRPRAGQRIEEVDAVGKHLLIHFDRNLTLRTHLGMSGSWRVAEPGAARPRDPRLRVLIETAKGSAMCFAAPTIDTYVRGQGPSPLDHLGPDLSDDEVDIAAVVERVRSIAPKALLADALLNQTIAAGIGNVFKSEVAFLVGVHPFTRIDQLSDAELAELWATAHQQLVANRERSGRKTTSAAIRGRTYVYDRFRRPCRRCSSSIDFSAAGVKTERSTYWCPGCQPRRSASS